MEENGRTVARKYFKDVKVGDTIFAMNYVSFELFQLRVDFVKRDTSGLIWMMATSFNGDVFPIGVLGNNSSIKASDATMPKFVTAMIYADRNEWLDQSKLLVSRMNEKTKKFEETLGGIEKKGGLR